MNTNEQKLVENYFEILKELSLEAKLALIRKLCSTFPYSEPARDEKTGDDKKNPQ